MVNNDHQNQSLEMCGKLFLATLTCIHGSRSMAGPLTLCKKEEWQKGKKPAGQLNLTTTPSPPSPAQGPDPPLIQVFLTDFLRTYRRPV